MVFSLLKSNYQKIQDKFYNTEIKIDKFYNKFIKMDALFDSSTEIYSQSE